jgi:hypothetical protein
MSDINSSNGHHRSGSKSNRLSKATSSNPTKPGQLNEQAFDELAVKAIESRFKTPGPAIELGRILDEQEAAIWSPGLKLKAKALRSKRSFDRDTEMLGDHISKATATLNNKWGPAPFRPLGPSPSFRDRLHVFVPDPQQTGRASAYRLSWGHIDGGVQGAGIGARTDPTHGTFWASHYGYGGSQLNAYAGIGVRLSPSQPWSRLSIRPFVNWSGYDVLSHRLYDPQLTVTGWGTAHGQIGIHVQSWDHSGGAFNNDASRWVTAWNRSEINPSGTRDYNGTEDARTLQLEVLVSNQRRYAIWVSCRAFIGTQARFGLDIRAAASVSCQLPFLFVEEMDL